MQFLIKTKILSGIFVNIALELAILAGK